MTKKLAVMYHDGFGIFDFDKIENKY